MARKRRKNDNFLITKEMLEILEQHAIQNAEKYFNFELLLGESIGFIFSTGIALEDEDENINKLINIYGIEDCIFSPDIPIKQEELCCAIHILKHAKSEGYSSQILFVYKPIESTFLYRIANDLNRMRIVRKNADYYDLLCDYYLK